MKNCRYAIGHQEASYIERKCRYCTLGGGNTIHTACANQKHAFEKKKNYIVDWQRARRQEFTEAKGLSAVFVGFLGQLKGAVEYQKC